jgi:cobalt-zinc-cadmium efflux system membrane fusion protein
MYRSITAIFAALLLSANAMAAPGLVVTPEQRAALGIELSDAVPVTEAPVVALPAVARLPGDSARAVVVPFDGTVVRLLAQDGQVVEQGQPLLQLRSRDFLQVAAEGRATEADLGVLRARVERDRALVAEGIAPARQLQESEAELRAAVARSASQRAMLSSARAAPGSPGDYQLLAPSAGVLVQGAFFPGDMAAAEQVAFFLYDGKKLWIDAQLNERAAGLVAPGYRVEAGAAALSGRVIAVGQTVDPATRGLLVRAELEADPGLRPGQVTELRVFAPVEPGTVLVPNSAVTRVAGQEVVFLETGDGFTPVPVQAGMRTGSGVAVKGEGLAGGRVASAGTGALKAMAQGN